MVVIAVAVFGVVSFTRLTTDLFPDVNLPFAVVTTTYPGANPEAVERDVTIPLERTFQTTTNIQEVQTISQENFSLIILEFSTDTNMDNVVVEMREQISGLLDGFPDAVGNPTIMRFNPDMLPIMNFSVSYQGKSSEDLTEWVDDVLTPQLERVAGVAAVNVSGGIAPDVRITLNQDALDEKNAELNAIIDSLPPGTMPESFDDDVLNKELISGLLQAQNISFPAGFVAIDNAQYLVRVGDAFDNIEAIRDLTLIDFDLSMMGLPSFLVSLDDVAAVEFVDDSDQIYNKVNGQNALSISVQKGSEFATTDVTNEINASLSALLDDNEGFEYTILLDQGEFINEATGSVINNLMLGGLLAVAILLIFLRNVRITLVVGVAIPISLLFALILIYLSGITLNLVSLGGLALGIGMLVDNSIVVIENIFRMKREGASNKDAAIQGASQVSGAIIASTITTVGVFLPIMFIEDFIREIFYQLALTITFSLLASLLIALTFVPAIANRVLRDKDSIRKPKDTTAFERFKNGYSNVLAHVFKLRVLVLFIVLGLFVSVSALAVQRGFEFFPATDEGTLMVTLTPREDMDSEALFDTLDELGFVLLAYPDVETVGVSVGGGGMFAFFGGGGSDSVSINIVLRSDRDQTTMEMQTVIDERLAKDYPEFDVDIMGTEADIDALVGSGIQIRITGDDLDTLRDEAVRLSDALKGIDGIASVDDGLGNVEPEIRITVDKEEATKVGLTNAQVMAAVNAFLASPERVTTVRINNRALDVYLFEEGQTEQRQIDDLEALKKLPLEGLMGTVLLEDIASVTFDEGFVSINRFNGARNVLVDAQLTSDANATLVAQDVDALLDTYTMPDGYELTVLGESEEIMNALETLLLMAAIGIMLVYMIMASQFQSFAYPLIIMITIPLAFTGGFGMLYLAGEPVSVIALIGLIILAGVVVNNGIVLVDYINQLREKGLALKAAIFQASRIRIRPIFMTALTTILALTGLAFGFGEGSELIQPLAFTAIGGLIYATLLTIFVVPIMYYTLTVNTRYVLGFLGIVLLLLSGVIMILQGFTTLGIIALTLIGFVIALVLLLPKRDQALIEKGSLEGADPIVRKLVE